jgi:hypothetical protein
MGMVYPSGSDWLWKMHTVYNVKPLFVNRFNALQDHKKGLPVAGQEGRWPCVG